MCFKKPSSFGAKTIPAQSSKPDNNEKDILATTGDYLRIWEIDSDSNKVNQSQLLNNSKNSEYCAPLTAFDWNETDRNTIVTSSIDTTCTIWDIEKGVAKTQLIAPLSKDFRIIHLYNKNSPRIERNMDERDLIYNFPNLHKYSNNESVEEIYLSIINKLKEK